MHFNALLVLPLITLISAVPVPQASINSTTASTKSTTTSTSAAASNPSSSVVFLLAGDSTTAKQKMPAGGGWGAGFTNLTLQPSVASAINYGHNGATTSSFINGGDWGWVLGNASNLVGQGNKVYVTIQFGHNDMKLGDGFMPTYLANLNRMVSDVKNSSATPIIVSSLSRRNFFADGRTVNDTLKPWAQAALGVANKTNSHSIDLWRASLNYVTQIGQNASHRLNLTPLDNTHLNNNGSIVFGRMVADLLRFAYTQEFKGVWKGDPALSQAIHAGVAAF